MSKINEYGQTCVQYRLKIKLYLTCKYLMFVDWNIIWRILSYHLYATIFIMPLFYKNVNVNHHFENWYLIINVVKLWCWIFTWTMTNHDYLVLARGSNIVSFCSHKSHWSLGSMILLSSFEFHMLRIFFGGQMWLLVKKD